jgi:ABC-type amino acid transport substrate-binding protein
MMLAFLVLLTVPAGMAGADALKKITETGELKLGYREDAAPFSSVNSQGVPEGYSIGLCKAIAAHVKRQTKLNKLKITYISVTSANRFKMLQDGKVDLLCGATTATISRRAIVDFSVPTFVTGATVMIKRDGPQNLEQMKGKNIGVLAATTTAKSLLKTLEKFSINAEVVPVTTHEDGMAKLKSGAISAYFGDRAILVTLIRRDTSKGELGIAARLFSIEPYAIALPHADSAFRQTVDEAISKVYRSKAIQKIYQKAFGAEPPSDLLKALYITSALPE